MCWTVINDCISFFNPVFFLPGLFKRVKCFLVEVFHSPNCSPPIAEVEILFLDNFCFSGLFLVSPLHRSNLISLYFICMCYCVSGWYINIKDVQLKLATAARQVHIITVLVQTYPYRLPTQALHSQGNSFMQMCK